MFVAAGAWWLVSEANQRNDSRGTSLLSYPAVLNSYPFPVIHPRAKEGINVQILDSMCRASPDFLVAQCEEK